MNVLILLSFIQICKYDDIKSINTIATLLNTCIFTTRISFLINSNVRPGADNLTEH
jgi:hypothetical protein